MTEQQIQKYTEEFKKQLTKEKSAQLIEIKDMLNRMFGEENNQIQTPVQHMQDMEKQVGTLSQGSFNNLRVIIRFPELKISNGRAKHLMRDLMVSFCINPINLRLLGGFTGVRAKLTKAEVASQYAHSHLSNINAVFSGFCTGSGPINVTMSALYSKPYEKELWQAFFYNIKEMVKWESKAGNPFRYLEQIGIPRQNSLGYLVTNAEQQRALERIFLGIENLHEKLELVITPETFTYRINLPLNNEIAELLRKNSLFYADNRISPLYLVHVNPSGAFYLPNGSAPAIAETQGRFICTFKGQAIYQQLGIDDDEKDKEYITKQQQKLYYAHPTIIQYITNWFNEVAKTTTIRLSYAKVQSSTYRNARITTSDNPVVQ